MNTYLNYIKNQEEEAKARKEEEEYDPMKALQNRTEESKREMDILDALDEIKTINSKHNRVNLDRVIDTFSEKKESGYVCFCLVGCIPPLF